MMDNTTLLKLQCAQLGLLIALSQGTKRWGERTVIMRKGKLVSVGGEIMPKDPPAYRVLTPEQWMRFIQGDIKNFGDINVKRSDTSTYVGSTAALSSISAGITGIDQDGQINNIVQAVYQDENKDAIIENIKATSPVKNNQFIEGISQFISNAKNGFDNAVESIKETIANTKFLTKSGEFLIQGLITGGLITAGIAAMGVFDLAIFGSAIPVIRNLAIVKKLTDPTLIWMTEKLGMSKLMATISSKILFGLTKLPIGLFIGECWQYLKKITTNAKNNDLLKEEYLSKEDREKIEKSLPKEIRNEILDENEDVYIKNYVKNLVNHTSYATRVIGSDKETFKLLVERLSREKQRDLTDNDPYNAYGLLNQKYTLARRLIEMNDILHKITEEEETLEFIKKENPLFRAIDENSHRKVLQDLKKSYTWHKGVIETELKYGSTLDELLLSGEDSDKNQSAMENLFSKLKSGKDSGSNQNITPDYTSYSDIPQLIKGKPLQNLRRIRRIDDVAHFLDQISQMSALKPKIKVGYTIPRGYQLPPLLTSDDIFINTGLMGSPDYLAYHEFGHALESLSQLVPISENYIQSRTYSPGLVELTTLVPVYGRIEITKISDFTDPYTSKSYLGLGSEVTSMALQNLSNPNLLKNALKQDREHILYGLWALDYKPGN